MPASVGIRVEALTPPCPWQAAQFKATKAPWSGSPAPISASVPLVQAIRVGVRKAGRDSDEHNLRLVKAINDDGRIYLTQTRVDGHVAIRFQAGQFEAEQRDIDTAFDVITEIAARLS